MQVQKKLIYNFNFLIDTKNFRKTNNLSNIKDKIMIN